MELLVAWSLTLCEHAALCTGQGLLSKMRIRRSFHAVITMIGVTTHKSKEIQVGPIPRGRPRRWEDVEKRTKDREERCFASTF